MSGKHSTRTEPFSQAPLDYNKIAESSWLLALYTDIVNMQSCYGAYIFVHNNKIIV